MAARTILVSYAGYPYTPSSLMPDNGLANLAGALLEAGHETVIFDYGTVEYLSRLYPAELSKRAMPLVARIFDRVASGKRVGIRDALGLRGIEKALGRAQGAEVHKIAQELAGQVEKLKPQFVGFKLWNGDGFSGTIEIACHLRRQFPRLKLFAGGPHADVFGELILDKMPFLDGVVFAEGEEAILGLAENVSTGRPLASIPNLIYRENGKAKRTELQRVEDLDTLPRPAYDSTTYPTMADGQKIKIVTIDESRGCYNRCFFCIQPVKSGEKLRTRSPARVVDEMSRLMADLHVASFRYAGSFTPARLAMALAEEILSRGLTVEYTSFGHVREGARTDYSLLARSGCYAIFFGVESGSQSILDRAFGKKIRVQDIETALTACKAAGIYTVGSVIYPAPFETEQTARESFELLRRIHPDSLPVQFPAIYPQTPWALRPREFNFDVELDAYTRVAMDYKIKLLYPPTFWEELPFRLNGMSFRKVMSETARFIRLLEEEGITTAISDDLALIAKHAGYQGREKAFLDQARQHFLSGDRDKVADLVKRVNQSLEKFYVETAGCGNRPGGGCA